MPSQSSENTTSPALVAEMLIRNYTKVPASDPQVFLAGLVRLLSAYRDIEWIPDPINGIPARFPYCPTLADIKAELDARHDHQERQNRFANWGTSAALPPPEETVEQREANANRLRALSAKLAESLAAERVPFKRKPLPTDAEMVPSDELVAIVKAKYLGPLPEAIE
jgi:hypothetical protein